MVEKDPHLVDWAKSCPQDEEKIKTFEFGDAMHAICLEPERLKSDFVVMPDLNLRTNAGKAERDEFIEANKDKMILTFDENKQLNLMFESVMAHKESRALIEADGYAESSWFWKDQETGLMCRCRPDKLINSLLVDVKTTDQLSKFCYSVDDYRYYVQDPFYCDGLAANGLENPHMEFLVIQKHIEIGRYPVAVVRLPEEAIEYGRMMYRKNLREYADFLSSDKRTETRELNMHYRFMNEAVETITPELYYE
jgi:exodeoxyribonuclease VIII